jgi:hypothetical protein
VLLKLANEWYEIARYNGKIKEVVKIAIKGGKYRGYLLLHYFLPFSNRRGLSGVRLALVVK